MRTLVFVTGWTGFVGKALFRAGAARDDCELVQLPRGQWVRCMASKARRGRAARLVHLAWPNLRASHPGASAGDGWDVYLEESTRLLEAACEQEVDFIGIGSGVEALVQTHAGDELGNYLEYARRKLEFRELMRRICPRSSAWLRLHFLFGPGEAPGRLIPLACVAASEGKSITGGNPERRRSWLHVDDAASALLAAASGPNLQDADICGPTLVTFSDLYEIIGRVAGQPLQVSCSGSVPGDTAMEIIPEAVPEHIPRDWGGKEYLLKRIGDYAGQLLESGRLRASSGFVA